MENKKEDDKIKKKVGVNMASVPIYQFYAELEKYTPKIWRRFQVLNNITMARLAYILMTMFEMQASHLYRFEIDELKNFKNFLKEIGEKYEPSEEDNFLIAEYGCIFEDEMDIYVPEGHRPLENAKDVKLKDVLFRENSEMEFKYDFGDGWTVKLILEKIFKDDNIKGKELPKVTEGQGFGIIENCGGVGGLEEIREAFIKKQGEKYEMYSNWLGKEDLDLDLIDIEDLNFRLKKLPRIFKDSYEYGIEPSKQSIKLIERQYKNEQKEITIQDQIKELTLLLLFLNSWKERDSLGDFRRAWKGYNFDVLNTLEEENFIGGSHKAKSVYLTEDGVKKAKKLMKKYGIKGN